MAVFGRDLFTPSAPETLNRIEVGTKIRQQDESEGEFGGGSLNGPRSMPGDAVPVDRDCARFIGEPFSHALQELNRMLFVAVSPNPDETLSGCEIAGAIPVYAI